jgi:ribosome-associated protein
MKIRRNTVNMREDMLAETEPKSKSQVKREMLALQALGKRLAELSPDRIKKIELPLELRDALLFCKTIHKGEPRRRQLQYIGALMREADTEPIQKALDAIDSGDLQGELRFKELERWRDELIDGNDELAEEILGRFPGTDRQTLRQLVLNARKEREAQKPPKASRALFRFLRGLSKPA